MNLGFKVGFFTTLGVLSAYYLYLLVTFVLTSAVVQPIIQRFVGGQ
jgi:hypothetical protein